MLKGKPAPYSTKNSSGSNLNVFSMIKDYDAPPPISKNRDKTDSDLKIQKKLMIKAGIYNEKSENQSHGVVPPAAERKPQESSIKAFEGKFSINKSLSQNQLFPLMNKINQKHKRI